MQPKIKIKPWGREIWWAQTAHYAGKLLELKGGARLSLQYHRRKEETQYLLSGKVQLQYGKDEQHLRTKTLKVGEAFHIPPKMLHRLIGVARKSVILEVSTAHLTDIVRLADDYGRKGQAHNEALDKKLARGKK